MTDYNLRKELASVTRSRHRAVPFAFFCGNEHKVIRGIGLVNCVYVTPETRAFWVINYRIYYPDGDGKTKIDHLLEML